MSALNLNYATGWTVQGSNTGNGNWFVSSPKPSIPAPGPTDPPIQWVLGFFYLHVTVHRNKFLFSKTNRRINFPNLFLSRNSTRFGQFLCPSGVFHCTFGTGICHASSSTTRMELHGVPSWSRLKAVIKPAWHIPVPNVGVFHCTFGTGICHACLMTT